MRLKLAIRARIRGQRARGLAVATTDLIGVAQRAHEPRVLGRGRHTGDVIELSGVGGDG